MSMMFYEDSRMEAERLWNKQMNDITIDKNFKEINKKIEVDIPEPFRFRVIDSKDELVKVFKTYDEARNFCDTENAKNNKDYSVHINKEYLDYMRKNDKKEYWYFTHHGVQPGSVPKGFPIIDIIDMDGGSYFLTDKVMSTKELHNYDIKEQAPDLVIATELAEALRMQRKIELGIEEEDYDR